MEQATIDQLIINKPYEEPGEHWRYNRETRMFSRERGRRQAGYLVASGDSQTFDDPGVFHEIPLVNQVRPRVKAWREAGYPGVTAITKRLLEYWGDPEEFESRRFFFCQLEAAETLIWLTEAPDSERVGVDIPGDGGEFRRLCAKMATGTGKTVVMAMVIAWHILNKVFYPQDTRFAKNVLVVAPGLTIKNRLAVLQPSHEDNYYEAFRVVPSPLLDKLRQGRVLVRNWHALNWESDEQVGKKRSVDKRGAKSDEAYVRDVLGGVARARNLLVINDEAHHAWRVPVGAKVQGVNRDEFEEATKWVGGLDRIHRARGILTCYDFSATPFPPSGERSSEEALFSWIVSDFGLNDAIESGLVKTPRVVVRDDTPVDAKTYRSRLYHIYNDPDVKSDLNRPAQPHEPLPDLVIQAYHLLGYDWRETAREWGKAETPPVMITVANRTETAARVKHAFDRKSIHIDELCDPARTLHIDSVVLKRAEESEERIAEVSLDGDDEAGSGTPTLKLTADQRAEHLRRMVDTVGRPGLPGEQVQNVISVRMLSEGWDAKTVTHIMGLRAFTSQLLCEQVVGRGLRRTSYEVDPETGMFKPDYVNIFGVPFTFLPHEGGKSGPPEPPPPKTAIQPVVGKAQFEIRWPNIVRIEYVYRHRLSLDWERMERLELDAGETAQVAELARVVDGKPDVSKLTRIDLEPLAHEYRTQKVIFEAARDVFDLMKPSWPGSRESLIAQLVRLVEQFLRSDRLSITPPLFYQDDISRRLILTLNMTRVVQHVADAVRVENTERLEPVFDRSHPIRSTGNMATWYTGKPCRFTDRSHINMCVFDSTWEASDAFELDHSSLVDAWVKNDHLGFEVLYVYRGVVRKYRPDFIVRLKSGNLLVLETKGQPNEQSHAKRRALEQWVQAVNQQGSFGQWSSDVSYKPGDIKGILAKHTEGLKV
ncbi:MAG: type III restriction endonuclease subunit R [Chloroflexi bacterium]|nr:type III restriction endonuclease subunit R [Chloroflexota bacterium]MYK34470.1 type III restriction endonuclease subunit R [Chloroflexota bacterium]